MKLVSLSEIRQQLSEATTAWMGQIDPQVGTGEPYTLNFGTGDPARFGMLYVPVPLAYIRSLARHVSRGYVAVYSPQTRDGELVPYSSRDEARRIVRDYTEVGCETVVDPGRRLTHVGEAHATISMGPELKNRIGRDPVGELKAVGLFDETGAGIPVRIRHTRKLKVLKAGFYKDAADPEGPLLIAEAVSIPQLGQIRLALGLSELPEVPGVVNYIPHITVGYLPVSNQIHTSYVARHGPHPR